MPAACQSAIKGEGLKSRPAFTFPVYSGPWLSHAECYHMTVWTGKPERCKVNWRECQENEVTWWEACKAHFAGLRKEGQLTPGLCRLTRRSCKEKVNTSLGKSCMIPTVYKGSQERGQERTDFPGEETAVRTNNLEGVGACLNKESTRGQRKWRG